MQFTGTSSRNFLKSRLILMLVGMRNFQMNSRLHLSRNIPVNSLKIRRYLEQSGSVFTSWKIFPVPLKITFRPQVSERGPGLSRIDFQIEFGIPLDPIWYFLHKRYLKRRINYFINRVYFFSISGKMPEEYPESFFMEPSPFFGILDFFICRFGHPCMSYGSVKTKSQDNIIIPLLIRKEELLEILPGPFRIPDEEQAEFEIYLNFSSHRNIQNNSLTEKLTDFFPDRGLAEIFIPSSLTTDRDFYNGYFRIPAAAERFLPGRLKRSIALEGNSVFICIQNKKYNLRLNLKTEPIRSFSNGDMLPEIMDEYITCFELRKDTLDIRIISKKQKIPVNKIHHVRIKEIHPALNLAKFFSGLTGLNYGRQNEHGYFIANILEHFVIEKEIPLIESQYRAVKKKFKERMKRSDLKQEEAG